MVKVEIRGATRADHIKLIRGEISLDTIEDRDRIAREVWAQFCKALKHGEINGIYWDCAPVRSQSGKVSFLRHTLTRSAKKARTVQLTTFQIRAGEYIALSDTQADNMGDLWRELPLNADVNIF